LKQKRIVITGGAGFIGSNLAEMLVIDNEITIIDDLSTGSLENIDDIINKKNITFVRGNILDKELLEKTFQGTDIVFHLAAISSVAQSMANPVFTNEVNIGGTLNVLIAAKNNNVRKVVFASSAAVYGNTPEIPTKENMPANIQSPYALTKITGEYYCHIFNKFYGLPTICLRYFNVYGPQQNKNSEYAAVIPSFISNVLNNKPPVIYGNGNQVRDFIFVEDVSQANIVAAESESTGVFNIGTGGHVTINELANIIMKILGCKLTPIHMDSRAGDVKNSLADIHLAMSIGYNPRYNLADGLVKTVGGFKMAAKSKKQSLEVYPKHVKQPVIAVVGLGYVGLPLAKAFCQYFKVIGFDTNVNKVQDLKDNKNNYGLFVTNNPTQLKKADIIIIAVPTPTTKSKEPDLSYIISAVKTISQNMKDGCTIVLESTVYPGVTEEVVKPILEELGRKCGKDFRLAYSPERINPGDEEHNVDKIVKIVGGMDEETTEMVAEVYRKVCGNVFKAKNIRTAEAAKVVENTQRDLNIAFVNELSIICNSIGLNVNDVLDAAATKWNFSRYSPGLVGGHCIPVVPYFLVHKAKEVGYYPQVILAGRSVNDYMPKYVAQQMVLKGLNDADKIIKRSKVLLMGLTYKENVPDIRETPAKEIIRELSEYGIELYGYDPLLDNIEREFGIKAVKDLMNQKSIDCIVVTVAHEVFRNFNLSDLKAIMKHNPVLVDIRGLYNRVEAEQLGFIYKTL
jgi:UDPglucose 6-dehydrogenase/UDP-N-acetyl-D-galactosamine dehydrogenase